MITFATYLFNYENIFMTNDLLKYSDTRDSFSGETNKNTCL